MIHMYMSLLGNCIDSLLPGLGYGRVATRVEFGISFFVTFSAILRLSRDSRLVEETGVPSKYHRLTPSHWQLPHMLLGTHHLMSSCGRLMCEAECGI